MTDPIIINATFTDDALKYWQQMFGGPVPLISFQPIKYFRIGVGGWIDTGAGIRPRIPDPSLRRYAPTYPKPVQDLDINVDQDRLALSLTQRYPGLFYVQ